MVRSYYTYVRAEFNDSNCEGPPGSGKTMSISAAVHEWVTSGSSAWLVAQSNVAVKNIAERLSKDGVKYRILVSREFYDEWLASLLAPIFVITLTCFAQA